MGRLKKRQAAMFGNSVGWTISAILTFLMAGVLYVISVRLDNTTEPTGALNRPYVTNSIELPESAKTLVVAMDSPGDAGPLYRQALNECKANPQDSSAGIEKVLSATKLKDMNLFINTPEEIVNYRMMDADALKHLMAAGKNTINKGLSLRKTDPNEAIKYFQAGYALGYKMTQERLNYWEFFSGLELMGDGATGLQKLAEMAKDKKRVEELQAMNAERLKLALKIQEVEGILNSVSQTKLEKYFGDVYEVARKSGERMWRCEAMLALGRYRFNAGTRGDQKAAEKLLKREAANQSDPAVRAAATAGRDLTVEQYRVLR
jgi:hypothetical protein